MEFRSLVPNTEEDIKKKPFLDALKWAISNDENKNIAITGSYGSGKSSIIETFIKKEKIEKETAKISITTFNKESKKENEARISSDTALEDILEQQILQQLFYKISPDKIPFSRFTSILEISKLKILQGIMVTLTMLLITYYLVNYNWLTKGVEKFISGDLMWAFFVSVITLVLISAYTYSIYYLILIIHKLGVSKFGFGSTLIEVGTNESNSVFNRYIDEIIYFFKKTEYKYIIFEDLDRFENLKIYERLKGLNLLLNSNQQLSDRRIVFIYALKDEIFVKEEDTEEVKNRTKFLISPYQL